MSDFKFLQRTKLEGMLVGVACPEEYPNTTVFVFNGELHSLNADAIFTGIVSPFGEWISRVKAEHTVVFDFYDLSYINSVGVGHIAQLAKLLHQKSAYLVLALEKDSTVYPVFEYVGLLEFPSVHVQHHRSNEGIELPNE